MKYDNTEPNKQWPPKPTGLDEPVPLPTVRLLTSHTLTDVLIGIAIPSIFVIIYGLAYFLLWAILGKIRVVDDPRTTFLMLCLPISGNIILWSKIRRQYAVLARSLVVTTGLEITIYAIAALILFVLPVAAPA